MKLGISCWINAPSPDLHVPRGQSLRIAAAEGVMSLWGYSKSNKHLNLNISKRCCQLVKSNSFWGLVAVWPSLSKGWTALCWDMLRLLWPQLWMTPFCFWRDALRRLVAQQLSRYRPFRVVRFSETRRISASRHGEGYGSRGSHDAGACRAELSRGVPGGKLHSDAAQSPRLGSKIT